MPTRRFTGPRPMAGTVSPIETPAVGVAVLLHQGGRILLQQRHNPPQQHSWQCPGGFLRLHEAVFDCARRRAEKDAGVAIRSLRAGPYTSNDFVAENRHTLTLYVVAELDEVMDSSRFAAWHWYAPAELPSPLFLPLEILLRDYSLERLLQPPEFGR